MEATAARQRLHAAREALDRRYMQSQVEHARHGGQSSTTSAPVRDRDLYPDLRAPLGKVARQLRRLLPDPSLREADFLRYHHADLPTLSIRQISHERFRIASAIGATNDSTSIPPWFDERLERLQHTSMKGRKR